MFVVAATAVMPYSDDGASGEGLLVSCVQTEGEAIEEAVKFMDYFRLKMISAPNLSQIISMMHHQTTRHRAAHGTSIIG